jgi:RNA polymerase sigma-70 factor (ECF subfamily)
MKTYSTLTENELVQAFMDGDALAFEKLFEKNKSRIFTSIYLIVKDHYLAEDIFQEVFIKVIEKIKAGSYSNEGRFLAWTMRIAHNLCMDHFRKINRRPTIKTSDNIDLFDTLDFAEDNRETTIIRTEIHDRVKKEIDKLPEDQREIIILRHYANLSFREIAELTNTSINTALGRMRYGLMNLRKVIPMAQLAS